jgi:putative flippase GtrA
MHFPRFLVAGGLNTVATYVLYLALLHVLPYAAAYTVTYAAGMVLGYLLNAYWVFRGSPSVRSALQYPAAYLLNYLLGLGLLWVFVEVVRLPAGIAPLAVLAITTPVMYLMSKSVFKPKEEK